MSQYNTLAGGALTKTNSQRSVVFFLNSTIKKARTTVVVFILKAGKTKTDKEEFEWLNARLP